MKQKRHKKIIHSLIVASFLLYCCNSNNKNTDTNTNNTAIVNTIKPYSSFNDTLTIDSVAAVFYNPDAIQLEKIKAINKKEIFESLTHEYFYQMRYAKSELKKNWPQIKIIEDTAAPYLLFIKKDKTKTIVNLNTIQDISGMIIFTPSKEPLQIDMMNIDTELARYFTK